VRLSYCETPGGRYALRAVHPGVVSPTRNLDYHTGLSALVVTAVALLVVQHLEGDGLTASLLRMTEQDQEDYGALGCGFTDAPALERQSGSAPAMHVRSGRQATTRWQPSRSRPGAWEKTPLKYTLECQGVRC
jgi:hypothetical protein